MPQGASLLQVPNNNKAETPKERLKRLMAAQINKQVAKDSVKTAQKIVDEEKERKARVQIERMHYDSGRRSTSPEPYRSVLSCHDSLELFAVWSLAQHSLELAITHAMQSSSACLFGCLLLSCACLTLTVCCCAEAVLQATDTVLRIPIGIDHLWSCCWLPHAR